MARTSSQTARPRALRVVHSGEHPRKALGARLRSRRERACLTLQRLATITKVSASMFAALEDGDLSRWPHGLYRRAYFRQYADLVGLGDDDVAEFERVFADEPPPQPPDAIEAAAAVPAPRAPALRRAVAAMVEWLTRKLSTA